MARFYGTVQGGRGEASRLGHAASGLVTEAASWSGAVRVAMYDANGEDCVQIAAVDHGGRGTRGIIFEGTVADLKQAIAFWNNRDQLQAVLALTKEDA